MIKKIFTTIIFCLSLVYSQASLSQSSNGTITFGIAHFYPPFVYNYNLGFDIALASAICKELATPCIFKSMPIQKTLVNLRAKQVDAVISAVSITPERQQEFAFTRPYLVSTASFLGLAKDDPPSTLENMRIGVIMDSTFEKFLKSTTTAKTKIISYKTIGDLIFDLGNKQVDLILLDTPVADYWAAQSQGQLKIIGQAFQIPFDRGFGIVTQKNNTQLASRLDFALGNLIAKGVYDHLVKLYFNTRTKDGNLPAVLPPMWMHTYYDTGNPLASYNSALPSK